MALDLRARVNPISAILVQAVQLASQLRSQTIGGSAGVQGGNSLPQVETVQAGPMVKSQPTPQQIETVVSKLSDFVQSVQRDLLFTVDDNTGDTVIIVKDSRTDEVVRQIPSEDLLQLAQNLRDLQEKLESSKGNLLEVRV